SKATALTSRPARATARAHPTRRLEVKMRLGAARICALLSGAAVLVAPPAARAAVADAAAAPPNQVGEVVVTASRTDLLGTAETASQGVVTRTEVELRPIFRVGQLLETAPGLVVTVHSGEGQ